MNVKETAEEIEKRKSCLVSHQVSKDEMCVTGGFKFK